MQPYAINRQIADSATLPAMAAGAMLVGLARSTYPRTPDAYNARVVDWRSIEQSGLSPHIDAIGPEQCALVVSVAGGSHAGTVSFMLARIERVQVRTLCAVASTFLESALAQVVTYPNE